MTPPPPPTATAKTTASEPGPHPADAAVAVSEVSHVYPPAKKRRGKHAKLETDRAALHQVSLDIRPGEVFGLLGPNGSGKSTLFRILATVQGATPPADVSAGSALVFGTDVAADPAKVRRQIGVVFQHPSLDDKLTAFENLRYHGMLHGINGSALRQRCEQALSQAGLADRASDFVASFSGGMRRRVEIAKALLTEPKLLLMDEASTGLDPAAQQALWQTLRGQVADHGLTVLLTTHLMHEARQCDRLAVLDQGRVVAIDTPAGLIARVGGQVLEIGWPTDQAGKTTPAEDQVISHLGLATGDPGIQRGNNTLRVELADAAAAVPEVAELLGDQADSIRVARPSLEDAYLKLTGSVLTG